MMRGVNPLKFFELEEWLRSWGGDSLKKMRPSYWFEVEGNNLLWAPALASAETVMELLLENCIQHPYQSHMILLPCLMTFFCRKQMGKEADLLFNVPMGTSFWTLE